MSSSEARRRRQDLEARALAAEQRIAVGVSNNARLENAISAAELYMQALRLADNAMDKKRLDLKTKKFISKAEEYKKSSDVLVVAPKAVNGSSAEYPISKRELTTRETIILLEGSKLNGAIFKPWLVAPSADEFELKDGQEPFTDSVELPLSQSQMKYFAGWKRARDAVALIRREKDGQLLPNEATMVKLGTCDLVQDVAPDCSVVASMCVGTARAERGHRKIIGSIVHPFDHGSQLPIISANGKYVMRLYFNGCWRRVEIDDRLPASKSNRVLHVIDRSHPGLIWPALAEKAYLKVRGGYDFPGSNSGTDLAVLSGWIPQQIFLHDEDVEPDTLWGELLSAITRGEIMLTLGTGRLGQREQRQLGLGAEHDYAVLDIKESTNAREMLIKNPWADGDVWKGATRCKPNPGYGESGENEHSVDSENMMPGTFWMDFNSVFQYFEHMYLNWDPRLFNYREDIHFTFHLADVTSAGNLLVDNPQFAVRTKKSEEVRILLNRHFRTGDYTSQIHGKNGFISIYLFNSNGVRVFSSDSARIRGPFVDSPNTLLRFRSNASETYTVVVVTQELPAGKHNFTLSTFSTWPVELSDAFHRYKQPRTLTAAWTRSTAGGSSDSPRYLQNPQFSLQIDAEIQVALVLKATYDSTTTKVNADIHVKVLVASSDGRRITKMRQRDTVAQSGDYRRGSAVLETTLPRGMYTIICSTFEQGQLSKFSLNFYSTDTAQLNLQALPTEGSGRLSILAEPAIFTPGVVKLIAPITVSRVTKALFRSSFVQYPSSAAFKISLEQGQGPYRKVLASSATDNVEYTSIASELRIADVNLSAHTTSEHGGGLWLVIERPIQLSAQKNKPMLLHIEVLTEERIDVGRWAPLDD